MKRVGSSACIERIEAIDEAEAEMESLSSQSGEESPSRKRDQGRFCVARSQSQESDYEPCLISNLNQNKQLCNDVSFSQNTFQQQHSGDFGSAQIS